MKSKMKSLHGIRLSRRTKEQPLACDTRRAAADRAECEGQIGGEGSGDGLTCGDKGDDDTVAAAVDAAADATAAISLALPVFEGTFFRCFMF